MQLREIRDQSGVEKYFNVLEFLERAANLLSNSPRSMTPRSSEISIINAALGEFRANATKVIDDTVANCIVQIVFNGANNDLLLGALNTDPCYWGYLSTRWGLIRGKAITVIRTRLWESLDKRFLETAVANALEDTLEDLQIEDLLSDEAILALIATHDELALPPDETLLDALQVRIDSAREQFKERQERL